METGKLLAIGVVLTATFVGTTSAQILELKNTTSTPVPGSGHDYLGILNETTNPANGSVSVRIQLPVPSGRGISLPFSIAYNSNGGHALSSIQPWNPLNIQQGGSGARASGGWSYTLPRYTYTPVQAEPGCLYDYDTNFVFYDALGGVHGLFLANNITLDPSNFGCNDGGLPSTLTGGDEHFRATAPQTGGGIVVSGLDGTAYTFNGGAAGGSIATFIEDANGNQVNIRDQGTLGFIETDTLGRTAISASGFGTNGDTISVSGLSQPYTLSWGSAPSSFSLSGNLLHTPASGVCPSFPVTNNDTLHVITAITMPDGNQYKFSYDPTYGVLQKITYPTGAWIQYTWQINALSEKLSFYGGNAAGNPIPMCHYSHDWYALKTREVSFDGTNVALHQDFSYSTTWTSGQFRWWDAKQTTVTTHDLITDQKSVTTYNYSLGLTQSNNPPDRNFLGAPIPVENVVTYQPSGGAVLKTVTKQWGGSALDLLGSEQVTLDNGLTTKKTYSYASDAVGGLDLIAEADEYDFGSGGSPGPLLRKMITQYASFANNSSVLDRPSSVTIYDGGGHAVSATVNCYDQNAPTPTSGVVQHSGTGVGNLTQQLRWLNPPGGTNSLPSCQTGASSSALSTIYAYDDTGQVLSTTDPNLNTTKYSYTDSYTEGTAPGPTNAYVTTITHPKTGNVNHVESFSYAYADGKLSKHTDENNQATSYLHNDVFRRLTEVDYPDGGKTTYDYNNDVLPLHVTKTVSASPDPDLLSDIKYDGFGNVHRTIQNADPYGTAIYTRTDYDGLGQPIKVWNPTGCNPDTSPSGCTGETTWGTTQMAYDILGRITAVTHPDGSVLSTSYSGRAADVTDEGNGTSQIQRITQNDALGRLVSVCEVSGTTQSGGNNQPAACNLDVSGTGFLTNYTYDTLGNLTKVSQAGINDRTFTYDSLSRLICASNPEISGSASCPNPDPGTYTAGTIRYSYDANGNLINKTSPKPNQTSPSVTVTATYSPDALNRVYQKQYSDATPTVHLDYDSSTELGVSGLTNVAGRLSGEYVTDGNGQKLSGEVFGYDALGRVKVNSQCTPQNCPSGTIFNVGYSYNAAGALHTATNGEGVTLTYGYDRASRLSSFTSSLADANHPGTLLSSTSYGPFGLTQANLGNGLQLQQSYQVRGWLQSAQVVNPSGLPGQGSVTISGSLQSTFHPATPGQGSVLIGGAGFQCNSDNTICDNGSLWVNINGGDQAGVTFQDPYVGCPASFNTVALYQALSVSATVVANCINANSPYVTASIGPDGVTINLTAKSSGSNTNYSLSAGTYYDSTDFSQPSLTATASGASLTNGADAYTTYDSGTTTITVNGQPYAYFWSGSSTTAASIASVLCSGMNGDTNGPVWATTNGTLKQCPVASNTITMAARNPGQSTNYTLRASSGSSYNSFSVSCPGFSSCDVASLTGGVNLATLYSFNINTFAPDGDITSANDSVNGNWTYAYDDLNRLHTAVANNGSGCKESYDRYGNRWSQEPYGTGNSCPAPSSSFTGNNTTNNNRMDGYSYDAAGNLLNDGCHAYTYDAENRVVSTSPVGSCTGSGTYTYDGSGRRVRRVTGSGTVDYLYDLADHAVTEVSGSGGWNRGELYAGARHIGTYDLGTTYFAHTDWLGNERMRTQMNQTAYSTWTSLPFGEGSSAPNPSPLHFTGKERDQETGLDYFGARYYTNGVGRWLTPDWAAKSVAVPYAHFDNPQSLNLYTYVGNNPVSRGDSDGHESNWEKFKAAISRLVIWKAEAGVGVGGKANFGPLSAKTEVKATAAIKHEGGETRSEVAIKASMSIGKGGTSFGPQVSVPIMTAGGGKVEWGGSPSVTVKTTQSVAGDSADVQAKEKGESFPVVVGGHAGALGGEAGLDLAAVPDVAKTGVAALNDSINEAGRAILDHLGINIDHGSSKPSGDQDAPREHIPY